MSDAVNEISPQGKAEAEAELEELREEKRPRIVAAIKAAREEGDLSENAEYHAAKDEQGHLEARIRMLEDLLANAEVVEAPTRRHRRVGSRVKFRDEDIGRGEGDHPRSPPRGVDGRGQALRREPGRQGAHGRLNGRQGHLRDAERRQRTWRFSSVA